MSSFADARPARFDGVAGEALARRLGVPRVVVFDEIGSTLDAAHQLAPEAPSGTLVIADQQTAGRGRHGRRWTSPPGSGVWLTLVERPADARALDVLALRCGLYAAEALDLLAGATVGVKWPNDLYVGDRKLAGILIETRWRGTAPEWVAIGFGINVLPPALDTAAGLLPGTSRLAVLDLLVPALRRAASASRHLSADELRRWASRDIAAGRRLSSPGEGVARGIGASGELQVLRVDGTSSTHRTGSLTFADQP